MSIRLSKNTTTREERFVVSESRIANLKILNKIVGLHQARSTYEFNRNSFCFGDARTV
jgi:hypothetical protein